MADSITAPYGLETNNPQPEIKRYYNLAKTPYANTAQVLSQVLLAVRYPGQTFNVANVEYWFKDGVADSNLVVKTAAPPTASNVGTEGVGIFKELSNNDYKFKKLTSSDNSVIFTENPSEPNIINVTLTKVEVGSLKTFYVNSQYPNTLLDADGSITRPFPNFDLARNAYMGTSVDILNPQYKGSKIILQTGAVTAANPTINGLVLEFQNNSILTYTGNDDYMFDTEVLYPLVPKNPINQDLFQDIKITLTGKGGITRTAGIGLVRGIGSNRNGLGTFVGKTSKIQVGLDNNDEISLLERVDYPNSTWNFPNGGKITDSSGTPLENIYGSFHEYSLVLAPTNPLMFIQYEAAVPSNWGVIMGGTVNFYTLVNTAINAIDTKLFGDKLNFLVYGRFIATVPDSPGGTTVTKLSGNTYYPPHPDRKMIELNATNIYCNEIQIKDQGGYATTSINDFLYITRDSAMENGNMQIICNYYIENFINLSDSSNIQTWFFLDTGINGSNIKVAKGENFLEIPTSKPNFTLHMPNTTVEGFTNKSTSATVITADTKGTLSSFFGSPVMSGIQNATSDANATSLGLIKNGLYFNTATGGLDIVH